MEENFEEEKEELKYLQEFKTGDFIENTHRLIYRIEITDEFCYLYELDANGDEIKSAKKRKITNEMMDGLIRNKHFSKSKTARRISYGEVESRLEFNRLVPK